MRLKKNILMQVDALHYDALEEAGITDKINAALISRHMRLASIDPGFPQSKPMLLDGINPVRVSVVQSLHSSYDGTGRFTENDILPALRITASVPSDMVQYDNPDIIHHENKIAERSRYLQIAGIAGAVVVPKTPFNMQDISVVNGLANEKRELRDLGVLSMLSQDLGYIEEPRDPGGLPPVEL